MKNLNSKQKKMTNLKKTKLCKTKKEDNKINWPLQTYILIKIIYQNFVKSNIEMF